MSIAGKRILVVEDEPMVAMLIEDMLADLGTIVLGPAVRLKDAIEIAEAESVDAAILDINLGAERSFPVAELLERKGIPFAFATGYGIGEHPFIGAPTIAKPYRLNEVRSVLETLFGKLGRVECVDRRGD